MEQDNLSSQLLDQLQGAPMQQLAQQLGANPAQTESAVAAALPLLLGALGRNTAQPQGADALFGALQRDHASVDFGSLLGGLLGGGRGAGSAGMNLGQDGAGILGHIFGNGRSQTEAAFGQATGLGGANSTRLLQLLAPLVLSFLAQRFSTGGGSAGGLRDALGQEQRRASTGAGGGLLGAILDRNGDGRVDIADLISAAGMLNRRG